MVKNKRYFGKLEIIQNPMKVTSHFLKYISAKCVLIIIKDVGRILYLGQVDILLLVQAKQNKFPFIHFSVITNNFHFTYVFYLRPLY